MVRLVPQRVQQIIEPFVEVSKMVPQKRMSKRLYEQIVEIPISRVVEKSASQCPGSPSKIERNEGGALAWTVYEMATSQLLGAVYKCLAQEAPNVSVFVGAISVKGLCREQAAEKTFGL